MKVPSLHLSPENGSAWLTEPGNGLPNISSSLSRVLESSDENWRLRAGCLNAQHPDDWFPEPGNLSIYNKRAIHTCLKCPVRLNCLDYALKARERQGIWGGLTESQRRMLRLTKEER